MKRIGLVVNPIAGMGGTVGLKGTDGGMYVKARELGATPIAPLRTRQFLTNIRSKTLLKILAAPREMGEALVKSVGIDYSVVTTGVEQISTAEDTMNVTKEMLGADVDLIVFVGGDGTARDIYDAVDLRKPVLGVPSGVKMYSSVFAVTPTAAAEIVDAFINGETAIEDGEVFDIDEDAFREGNLDIKLYGYLKVLKVRDLIQSGKEPAYYSEGSEENRKAIARYIAENAEDGTVYLLGPGTTTKAIADAFKVEKSLLGVDAVYNRKRIGADLNEKGILDILGSYHKAKLVISPIGGQGFIFGRGNQQFTPRIIESVGKESVIVVATKDKMRELSQLRVDTGDAKVDEMLRGFFRVITDYNEELLTRVT